MSENQHDVQSLVDRLTAIRERLFWLQAVFANSLSSDVFMEAERYRKLFRDLGDQLKQRDPAAFDSIVSGHEALLLSEPAPAKPSIPAHVQELFEAIAQAPRAKPKPRRVVGYLPDGLADLV